MEVSSVPRCIKRALVSLVCFWFVFGCATPPLERRDKTGLSDDELRSFQTSVSSLKAALLVPDVIRTSVSAIKSISSAKNVSSRSVGLVTGRKISSGVIPARLITARAPEIRSPKVQLYDGGFCPAPFAPRLSGKQWGSAGGVCQAYDLSGDNAVDYIILELSNCGFYGLTRCTVTALYLDRSNLSISFSGLHKDVYVTLDCGDKDVPLSCEGSESDPGNLLEGLIKHCEVLSTTVYQGGESCTFEEGEKSADYWISSSDESFFGVYVDIGSGVMAVTRCGQHSCSYSDYNCPATYLQPVLENKCADVSKIKDYTSDLTKNCNLISTTSGSFRGGLICLSQDYDSDGKEDGISISQGSDSIHVWVDDSATDGEGYVMYLYCESSECSLYTSSYLVGQNNCNFSASCDNFSGTITAVKQSLESLLEDCKMVKTGLYTSSDGSYNSCIKDDLTGDGLPDLVLEHWEGDNGYSIIVESNGNATKYECENHQCAFYASEACSVDCEDCSSGCEVSCEWVSSGSIYSPEEDIQEVHSCLSYDFNDDGEKELLIFSKPSANSFVISIVKPEISVVGECTFGAPGEYLTYLLGGAEVPVSCEIKIGRCEISCENVGSGDINSIISARCVLEPYANCEGLFECEAMVYSILGFESDPQEGYCSGIKDAAGNFVEIRKVSEGYEYVKGTTKDFSVVICPLDSKVDYSVCAIYDCEYEEASATVGKLLSFEDSVTVQVFTFSVSDIKGGIEGSVTVEYHKQIEEMWIKGNLRTLGEEFSLDGYVKKDGSADISFSLSSGGTVKIRGKLSIKPDGNGTGEIVDFSSDKRYKVELRSDGTFKVCTDAGTCEVLS